MITLRRLLSWYRPDMETVARHLDELGPAERTLQCLALGPREQARLFEAAQGFRALTLTDLVPAAAAPMEPVPHEGRNSLPAFRRFAKVFCRPDGPRSGDARAAGADQRELWGYNRNPGLVSTAVGPGYFIAREDDHGELVIDYDHVPPRKPAAWPPILPNSSRLSRFVYYRTQDYLRGVSSHVTIGRATRAGKIMDNWFVLCRQDPS